MCTVEKQMMLMGKEARQNVETRVVCIRQQKEQMLGQIKPVSVTQMHA